MSSAGEGPTGVETALRDRKEKVSGPGPTRERGGRGETGAGKTSPSSQGETRSTCKPHRMSRTS